MLKIETLFAFFLLSASSFSQDKISTYKSKADKLIASYFDHSLVPKIKCTNVVVDGLDSNLLFYSNYTLVKNKKVKFSTIAFSYSFFSQVLNYRFYFNITIGRDKKILPDSTIFEGIPKCIAENINCNFLTKDSALRIAINDSISYPKNLNIDLYNYQNSGNYFWLVRGSPIEKKEKTTKKRSSKKRTTSSHLYKEERIINALTGKIIPHNEYFQR